MALVRDPTPTMSGRLSVSTAGDLVKPHPHLHCIVSSGAWVGDSLLPWPDALTGDRLEALFRRHVLKMLVRQERLEQDTADRPLRWGKSGFSVFVGEPIAHQADESLPRLASYPVKPPVCLQRLSYDQTTCTVTYISHN
ncbi:MAG: transposase [Candidatus Xenobia bacterium]